MKIDFGVSLRAEGEASVLTLSGDLTAGAEAELVAAYRRAAAGAQRVVFDFSAVEYVNSSGVAILIAIAGEARRAGRQLAAVGLTPHYSKVFEIVGLNRFIALHETLAQALG